MKWAGLVGRVHEVGGACGDSGLSGRGLQGEWVNCHELGGACVESE